MCSPSEVRVKQFTVRNSGYSSNERRRAWEDSLSLDGFVTNVPTTRQISLVDVNSESSSFCVRNASSGSTVSAPTETNEETVDLRQCNRINDLESYFRILRYLGISNYKHIQFLNIDEEQFAFPQDVCFYIYSTFAALDVTLILKAEIMNVIVAKTLTSCIRFGFAFVRVVNTVIFLRLITCHQEKISIMLKNVGYIQNRDNKNGMESQFSRTAVFFVATSVLVTLLTAGFGYSSFVDWTPRETLQFRSFRFAKDVLLWKTTSYDNDTDLLFEEYYNGNFTASTAIMGIMEGVIQISGTLQEEIIRDILVIATLMLLHGWKTLEEEITPFLLIHPNNGDNEAVENCLQKYKLQRKTNNSVNTALGTLLKFVVIQSLLLYAYFFVQIITSDEADIWIFRTMLQAIKTTLLFYIALKVHSTNDNIKAWFRLMTAYKTPRIIVRALGMTQEAAMDDLSDNNAGLGTGYFLINESFVVGFFAAVASIITFLVESENKDCQK